MSFGLLVGISSVFSLGAAQFDFLATLFEGQLQSIGITAIGVSGPRRCTHTLS